MRENPKGRKEVKLELEANSQDNLIKLGMGETPPKYLNEYKEGFIYANLA